MISNPSELSRHGTADAPPGSGFSTDSRDSGVLQVLGSGSDAASASSVASFGAGGKCACGSWAGGWEAGRCVGSAGGGGDGAMIGT